MTKNLKKLQALAGFAEACYNQNSIDELIINLERGIDNADCVRWNMSGQEWRNAIGLALRHKIVDAQQ